MDLVSEKDRTLFFPFFFFNVCFLGFNLFCFAVRVVKPWKRFPREGAASPSVETFKI